MNESNKEKLSINLTDDSHNKRNEWRRKSWTIPDLRGGKNNWFSLIKSLIKLLNENKVTDLDTIPIVSEIGQLQTWRSYGYFLKSLGLVSNQSGALRLSEEGIAFFNDLTKNHLANIIYDKIRLFGETLNFINMRPMTVEEVNEMICKEYNLDWSNLSNTRRRMDWLEALDLIQGIGNRKWEITKSGRELLKTWEIISLDDIELLEVSSDEIDIQDPPEEIAVLIQQLFDSPELHNKRNTYNIWAPSPNRIENLRIILQSAIERISKNDFFQFISKEFKLKISSVESMIPFLKASGLIEEVGRNVYMATPAAKAWVETGNDLDFIRILHTHMQFVGEMIKIAENDIVRNDMYCKGKTYGLNAEKCRWIVGFLIEAGLLEEPQYLHLKATPLGNLFVKSLPLLEKGKFQLDERNIRKEDGGLNLWESELQIITTRLSKAATDPMFEGKGAGVALEESISEIFTFMGFDAKRIGGSGDTDVVVRWKDSDGKNIVAIVDGKSKSNGQVNHSDISDVALDAHKDKNNANYVAIVGAHFSGDTIKNHARKKDIALITTEQLIDVANASRNLGLSLSEISLLFKAPNGFLQLDELISSKQRELDIISNVISKFYQKQEQLDGALTPRDLFWLLADSHISPSLEELISVFDILSNKEIGVLEVADQNRLPENTMYVLCSTKKSVFRLCALARTIEKSIID